MSQKFFRRESLGSPLAIQLGIVLVSMLFIMFIYEVTKQIISPDITIWESHTITIVFTSLVAVVIMYFPLRSAYLEQQISQEALRNLREAEERLRRSEVQYRSFVESIEDSIYTVDPELRYLLINARHLVRRGLSPDQYIGKKYGDFHSAEETRVFTAQVKKVLDSKAPVQDEYEQNGRHYLRKLSPVIDPASSTVMAATAISTDITDRKKAERCLEIINRKLNLMNDITRHDMLNQLTVLNSYLTLIGEYSSDQNVEKYVAKSEHAINTIHAQIFFARDYQRIGVERPQWQNLAATIQKGRLSLKTFSVMIDEQCTAIEILADPLLEKVFFNIMDNALRYAGPDPQVRFSVTEDQGRLRLMIGDNGPGVPQENKEKIFLRGFGKNSGLGLFLIREILSMTDISIREIGRESEGSRFEITIPAGSYRHSTSPEHAP